MMENIYISPDQERVLHDILDRGINEIKQKDMYLERLI